MSIWRWADRITPISRHHQVTLGEGETPLVRSRHLGPTLGLDALFFKLESANPTGSYKDRFAAAAVSHMCELGKRTCVATSSGNTGAALAAYCAAAAIDCRIAIVETAPTEKLQQMMAYGASIFRIEGFGLDPTITANTFARLQQIGSVASAALQISAYSYSPAGMSGVETIAFELNEQLASIDHVFCPAGGGGLCVAVARGFSTLAAADPRAPQPAIHCVQPTGNDTIATPLREGQHRARAVDCRTEISGLQVASVIDGDRVIEHCRSSGGTGFAVDDSSIWQAQRQLARTEGIFAEPAGATALAGVIQAVQRGEIAPQSPVVCLVTGSGFKDAASVQRLNADAECPLIRWEELERFSE